MLLTAVHIDDNEVTNDSVISDWLLNQWLITESLVTSLSGLLPIYDRTIVTSQSLQYDFYWTKMRPEINNR